MARYEKTDITIVRDKGQVVIPKPTGDKLGIKPKTNLLVYSYEDAVIMKKLKLPDAEKRIEEMYRSIDRRIARYGEPGEEVVLWPILPF
ncbi:MAG: AbrB/MazE/SpoVT family DNA-binding domain-containing protein [Aigarchaeota archaeon]|nr:AbrB/MazE/SpoVT family DNA-binding domain-containing protein [Candidatus Pelearchaeum maunauluense]